MVNPITDNEALTDRGTGDGENDSLPWPQSDEAVADWVGERQKKAEQRLSKWYDDAATDFEFYENTQWTDEDAEKLTRENRVAVTFNRIAPVVNAICGQEVANRQEVKYLPRRVGPVNAADPLNDAVKWARENCNAEDEDSDAFRDLVICGMGWTVTRMDYEDDPEGMPKVERRDPMLMRWDVASRRKNLADARWVQSDYWMTQDEIEDRWPKADFDTVANLRRPTNNPQPIDATNSWQYNNNAAGYDAYADQYRVVHHVEKFTVYQYKLSDPATGQVVMLSEDDYKNLTDNAKKAGVELPDAVSVPKAVYWEAWVIGDTVLKAGPCAAQTAFPYQCMTGTRERETGYWFGIVRMMLDPQRYANRLMSLMMSILGTGAKGGLLYETGAFANPKKAVSQWARWDSAIELTPGSLAAGKVQPKQPVQLPQGAADLMSFAVSSIRDVTGVNIELLGGENNNQTGVVEGMKTKAGLTILAGIFDAMRLYRKRQGILLAEFVREFISDGRLIRILGPSGEQYVPLVRGPGVLEYDIVVDESPTSRDVKERTWVALQTIGPMAMQMGLPMPPSLLDYSPLPQSLVMEWKNQIQQQQQQREQQPPKPDPLVEAAQAKAQADMQIAQIKSQAQIQADQSRVAADVQIAQHAASVKAELDAQKSQAELHQKAMLAAVDRQTQLLLKVIDQIGRVEAARVSSGMDSGAAFVTQAGYPPHTPPPEAIGLSAAATVNSPV